MEQIARPFLVLAMTDGSAAHVGGVLAVRTLPQLFFGVFAGVISDWFDRRAILLWTKVSVLILSIVFAALMVVGRLELWHVYLFQFLRGVSERDIYVMLMLFAFLVFRPGGLFAAPGGRD